MQEDVICSLVEGRDLVLLVMGEQSAVDIRKGGIFGIERWLALFLGSVQDGKEFLKRIARIFWPVAFKEMRKLIFL